MRFYARVGSLQSTRTNLEAFLAEVARARCDAVLFCPSPGANKTDLEEYPDAATYVEALREKGWRIKGGGGLGRRSGYRAANLRHTQAPTAPINVTARDVRAQFGWL
ncbi:MAG: hypothetical protein R3E42_18615 [Burkholderiaceae bacterium]